MSGKPDILGLGTNPFGPRKFVGLGAQGEEFTLRRGLVASFNMIFNNVVDIMSLRQSSCTLDLSNC